MPLPKSVELKILKHRLKFKKRFVACFDFLGTKKLTREHPKKVLRLILETLDEVEKRRRLLRRLNEKDFLRCYSFSDSFVIYTSSDSKEAFAQLLFGTIEFFNSAL